MPNRRDFLRTAVGTAAAVAVGGPMALASTIRQPQVLPAMNVFLPQSRIIAMGRWTLTDAKGTVLAEGENAIVREFVQGEVTVDCPLPDHVYLHDFDPGELINRIAFPEPLQVNGGDEMTITYQYEYESLE